MNALQDLKFALRGLRAHPGTAAFATLTLALGLGAALAIQAVIGAVLLRELPFPEAGRIVALSELNADGGEMAMAWPNYADLAATGAFDATALVTTFDGPLTQGSAMRRARSTWTGGDFFRLLGTAPALGRNFDAQEREPVAVVSHGLWQGLLQGRPDVLGQSLEVGGETFTIIGVMPAGFDYPAGTAAWVPFTGDPGSSRTAHNWEALGRLAPGATLAEARLAAGTLASRLVAEHGEDIDLRAFGVTPLAEALAAPVRTALLMLGAGTLFLLLIAITNTANLLLALNGARARELAVRAALGASHLRLARQVFAEAALIAALACVIGLGLAWAGIRMLVHGGGAHLPRAAEIGLGPGSVGLALLAALAIAMVTSAAVLLGHRRHTTSEDLRGSGRGQSASRSQLRLRAALLVGQTGLTTVLLVAAGLLGRSFLALLAVDPGFDTASAVHIQLSRPFSMDSAVAAETARRYQAIANAIGALPGVEGVGGVNALPLSGRGSNGGFWDGSVTSFDAHPPPPIGYAEFRVASAGYLQAAGIPLLAGRDFDERDRPDGAQVALVSAAAARATWGDTDPIGRRIQYGNMDGDTRILTVVGVVGDVHQRGLERPPAGTVYVNLAQRPLVAAEFSLVVRSSLPLASLMPALRMVLEAEAADIPHSLAPLADLRAGALADRRFSLVLLGAFASAALVLAVGGLYGLMAFAVGQRSGEFALRQALGASRGRIAGLVLGNGLFIGGLGIAFGLALAIAGTRVFGGLLHGVSAHDPLTLASVAVLLALTLLAACAVPAGRACRVAPREALS